jgi:predicted nucleic acid-binding protein
MAQVSSVLIDTSMWIALLRTRTPSAIRELILPVIGSPYACYAEPIAYEAMRNATDQEASRLTEVFETVDVLTVPDDVWVKATKLGQACRRKSVTAGPLDLIIAVVALEHDAEIVTLDADFEMIARACSLRARRLVLPGK